MDTQMNVEMPIVLTTEMRHAFVAEMEAAKKRCNGPHVTADHVYSAVVSVATGIPISDIYKLWNSTPSNAK